METRDHYESTDFDAEEKTVRKFTQARTTHISKDHLELLRIFLQSEDSCFNFFAKTHPQAAMPGLVPILSLHEFGSRGWRENHLHRYRRRSSSARNCSHVTA